MEQEETLYTLEVPVGYQEDERIDVYITRFLANATRSKVQKGIKEGRVRIDGERIGKVSHKVQAGNVIECRLNRPPPIVAAPEDIPIDVVYEDDSLLVINKKAGMVVHPAYGHRSGTLVNALLHHLGSNALKIEEDDEEVQKDLGLSTKYASPRSKEGIDIRPGIVHRLDKDTSGLIVVAKDDVTHTHLAKQFFHRTTRRTYEALVWGNPEEESGRIENYVGRDSRDRKKMAIVEEGNGKLAITNYKVEESYGRIARVTFKLETGRTHQIRIHAASMGHPIFCDVTYGGRQIRYGSKIGTTKMFFHNLFTNLGRQALHARTLGFRHPKTNEEMDFNSELPEDISYVISRLVKANID